MISPLARMSLCLPAFVVSAFSARAEEGPSADEVLQALARVRRFVNDDLAAHGGFLWRYSEDLRKREGEARADADTLWVQPPATPTVGEAFLLVYRASGEREDLRVAWRAARALAQGQLASGGWDYHVFFDAPRRLTRAYRADGDRALAFNVSTYDDDTTQAALRLLFLVDRELGFRDATLHEAAVFGLEALLKAQYPDGSWPQRYRSFPNPAQHPILPASYPDTWPRRWPARDYRAFATFNDNTLADCVRTLFLAHEVYDDLRFRDAALKAGDFVIRAQMPDPQPAWAQQYDAKMHPAWARKFEPPAITGGESQGVLRLLLDLYRRSGERRFLAPVPRALDYLEASRLPDGRLARFYELKTNRPLYFTRKYELTYQDDDLPTHYSFQVGSGLEGIRAEYERLKAMSDEQRRESLLTSPPQMTESLKRRARAVLDALDDRGRWVQDGRLKYHGDADDTRRIIDMGTLAANLRLLAEYLSALKKD